MVAKQQNSIYTYINNQVKTCDIYPLNPELNPICHLLALLEAHHILHVSRIRVKYFKVFI